MNTPRSKPLKRYDKERLPKNSDLDVVRPTIYTPGLESPEIIVLLGEMIGVWSHLEEDMIYIFAVLAGTLQSTRTRDIPIYHCSRRQDQNDALLTRRNRSERNATSIL